MISRKNSDHYVWGNACEGWHLIKNPAMSIIEESMPPGTHEVRHYHERAWQFFYVVRGALLIEVEGSEQTICAGEGVEIGPGQKHQVKNVSDEPADFLVVSHPPSHGDRTNV